jgi:cystathionine beta-synthase
MQKEDIDQLIVMSNGVIVGSLTDSRLYSKLLENPEIKKSAISEVMEKPFPIVDALTPYNQLSAMINRENPAVLVEQSNGQHKIITKYDIIRALAG